MQISGIDTRRPKTVEGHFEIWFAVNSDRKHFRILSGLRWERYRDTTPGVQPSAMNYFWTTIEVISRDDLEDHYRGDLEG